MSSATLTMDSPAAIPASWISWGAAYLVISAVAAICSELDLGLVAVLLKPLPLLLLLYEVGKPLLQGERSRLRTWIWLGLLLSVIGDMVIIKSFIGGIAAFFLAHVCYLVAVGFERSASIKQAACYVPAVGLWAGMYVLLTPRAPEALFWPVVAYLSIISLMYGRMISRAFATHGHLWSRLMFFGATLFVLSDSLIAINKWVTAVPWDRLAIMGTYYAGQWLISRGVPPLGLDYERLRTTPAPAPARVS